MPLGSYGISMVLQNIDIQRSKQSMESLIPSELPAWKVGETIWSHWKPTHTWTPPLGIPHHQKFKSEKRLGFLFVFRQHHVVIKHLYNFLLHIYNVFIQARRNGIPRSGKLERRIHLFTGTKFWFTSYLMLFYLRGVMASWQAIDEGKEHRSVRDRMHSEFYPMLGLDVLSFNIFFILGSSTEAGVLGRIGD